MARKKSGHLGYPQDGKASSSYLSPQGPYTGDGKTTRSIYDRVAAVFVGSDGKKQKKKK